MVGIHWVVGIGRLCASGLAPDFQAISTHRASAK
jgi:hypothetical protein